MKAARGVLSLAAGAAAALAAAAAGAPAQPAPGAPPARATLVPFLQTPGEALAQDAGEYARQFDLPLLEAARRLRAQEESVAMTDHLQALYRDRLAGVSVTHRPDYRITLYLTGDRPIPPLRVAAGGMIVPIVFRTGAKATRDRVVWAMTNHQHEIRAMIPSLPAMGLDPRTGELVLILTPGAVAGEGAAAIKAKVEALTGVPVQVRVQDRIDVNLGAQGVPDMTSGAESGPESGPESSFAVDGGSRVEGLDPDSGRRHLCTTGFVVTDGRRLGITTAAHCADGLTLLDPRRRAVPLDMVGAWGWGYRDVQIHVGGTALRPLFYADAARSRARPVTARRRRTSTRAGDFVCHRGETSGYSCAQVELIDFAPAGNLCAGACLPTWVSVAGPNCRGGDSGGPVFAGTTAFGIVKGASYRPDRSCAFYFYMSTDYLPDDWTLLRE